MTRAGNGTADFNTAIGGFALRDNVNGARNTAVGAGALEPMLGGADNTAIGELAGSNYNGTESNNVCIDSGTEGTAGESNAIRIGNASTSGGITLAHNSAVANAITIGPDMSTEGITILTLLGFGSVSIGNGLQTTNGASTCFVGGIFNQTPVGWVPCCSGWPQQCLPMGLFPHGDSKRILHRSTSSVKASWLLSQ